jgi:hypothetical protein
LQWIAVEDLLDTGEAEAVYNFRIAVYHTYFVIGKHARLTAQPLDKSRRLT